MEKYLPHIDECRYVILKMIEQAVRDFLGLKQSVAPIEQEYYHTASEFLFGDNYYVDWGGVDRSLEDFLDILGLDLLWFRSRIVRLKNKKIKLFRMRLLAKDLDELEE